MIDTQTYASLCAKHTDLSPLSDKVAELLRDELTPQEKVQGAWAMTVGKVPGALVLTERRLIAVYTTRLLVFFNFATIQEFDLLQVRRCELNSTGVFLRATPTSNPDDEDYEENQFGLTPDRGGKLLEALKPLCPALA